MRVLGYVVRDIADTWRSPNVLWSMETFFAYVSGLYIMKYDEMSERDTNLQSWNQLVFQMILMCVNTFMFTTFVRFLDFIFAVCPYLRLDYTCLNLF